MSSELSIYAERLRGFLAVCTEEFAAVKRLLSIEEQRHADAEFNGMALLLFALQFGQNAAYRQICAARQVTPDTLTHWAQIPVVPTTAFKELELTCLRLQARTHVFHSSGTTEQRPSRHFHCAQSLELYEASLWPWFVEHCRWPMADGQFLALTPPPAQAPHSSLVHMFETVRRKLDADAEAFVGEVRAEGNWAINFAEALERITAARQSNQPVLLLGTAFGFVHLLDHLIENDLRLALPRGSRVMETGGYKGRSRSLPRAELHALITDRLHVPASDIVCEYGMSELSSQAYASANSPGHASRAFRFAPWTRAQVISPETGREVADGETGLLRVFDLANVFSVLAIQTEDLAIRRGDGFELIGRAPSAEPRGCSLMAAANS